MMKIGDKVTVPAGMNGCNTDLPAIVSYVKTLLGKTRVIVSYLHPDPFGRTSGVYYDYHLKFRF